MKRRVEFTAAELATLMIAMNMEKIRVQDTDSPTLKKHVSELRDKIASEYLIADGRQAA